MCRHYATFFGNECLITSLINIIVMIVDDLCDNSFLDVVASVEILHNASYVQFIGSSKLRLPGKCLKASFVMRNIYFLNPKSLKNYYAI